MKLFSYFKTALSNVRKSKIRTSINLFSISVGIMLITTMLSLGNSLQNFVISKIDDMESLKNITIKNVKYMTNDELELALSDLDQNGDIDIDNLFKEKPITNDIIKKLQLDNRIKSMTIKQEAKATELSFGKQKVQEVNLVHYDGAYYLDSDEYKNVSYICDGTTLEDEDSVLVPENFVTNILQGDTKSVIGKTITVKYRLTDYENAKVWKKKLKISGIIDRRYYETSLVVSKNVIEELKNFENEDPMKLEERGADTVNLSLKNVSDVYELNSWIQNDLKYMTESVANITKTIHQVIFGIKIAFLIIGLIVVFISSLDVVNTMIMSIHEKKQTIGIMRAVGATKCNILLLFCVESSVIGMLGGIIGVIFSYFSIMGIKTFLMSVLTQYELFKASYIDIIVKLDVKTAIYAILLSTLLSVVAGIYPAIMASRLKPIDAIKND